MSDVALLLDKLERERSLSMAEYEALLASPSPTLAADAAARALAVRRCHYGNRVFVRGLIEISNICKNDCLYCGIRKSNQACERYRLEEEDILACCEEGHALGFRTFVLQGGEDGFFSDDRLCAVVRTIKSRYPDCAVTLSMGERSFDSYRRLKEAGADRYLLRHETADAAHYARLHPENLTLQNRLRCLDNLKTLGFQVGCGMMVGSPFQTNKTLAADLKLLETFKPDMVGIGPFLPHDATPFRNHPKGSLDMTLLLLSLTRLLLPTVLLPATTALATLSETGREQAMMCGANVVMPNLSPLAVRQKYMLYNDKVATGDEAAQSLAHLKARMAQLGFDVVADRGDAKHL